jgi:uncharacterized heparinase superfamily protein
MQLLRFWQTIRHLKPVQLYGRLLFMIGRRFMPPARAGDEVMSAKDLKRLYPLVGLPEVSFKFLHHIEYIEAEKMRWQGADWPSEATPEKLWRYNLNYFSWLFSQIPEHKMDQKTQLFLILDWIEKNVSARSETWEPYVISKRLVNWSKWLTTHKNLVEPVRNCICRSIFSQLKRLSQDIEYHNQANHLFENLSSMLIASLFLLEENFKFEATLAAMARKASNELLLQLEEQFFPDGGHYERSPMYHSEMLETITSITESSEIALKNDKIKQFDALHSSLDELLELCAEKKVLAKDWLENLTHPDGFVAQFNDCAQIKGIRLNKMPGEKALNYLLTRSGFFVRRNTRMYFALSCKEPSPSFQPGHTHCDILSYELSIDGLRCIVDTGCGSYQNQTVRQHCRTTSSHNVPLIELSEQSDIWGAFRIGKRARVVLQDYDSQKGLLTVEFIDQYEQKFRREVIFANQSIKIRDRMFNRRITGTFCSNIHLHPEILLLPSDEPGIVKLQRSDLQFCIRTNSIFRTESHEWYPEFGRQKKTVKLILSNHETEAIDYVISW